MSFPKGPWCAAGPEPRRRARGLEEGGQPPPEHSGGAGGGRPRRRWNSAVASQPRSPPTPIGKGGWEEEPLGWGRAHAACASSCRKDKHVLLLLPRCPHLCLPFAGRLLADPCLDCRQDVLQWVVACLSPRELRFSFLPLLLHDPADRAVYETMVRDRLRESKKRLGEVRSERAMHVVLRGGGAVVVTILPSIDP